MNMRLIIAEKPELGRAIADALFTHPETHDSVITEGNISQLIRQSSPYWRATMSPQERLQAFQ